MGFWPVGNGVCKDGSGRPCATALPLEEDTMSRLDSVGGETPPIPRAARPNAPADAPAQQTQAPTFSARAYGLTDPGRLRPSNEDQFLVAELGRTLWVRQTSLPQAATQHGRGRGLVLLVADGMGGHAAGEVASALSVETVEAFVLELL